MFASSGVRVAGYLLAGFGLALAACRRRRSDEDQKKGADEPPSPPVPDPAESTYGPYPPIDIPMDGPVIYVWNKENRVESDSVFVKVKVPFVAPDAQTCTSRFFRVEGQTPLNGNFKNGPFAPGETIVTQDGFDQQQACFVMNMMTGSLMAAGFPVDEMFKGGFTVKVNSMTQLNAFYNPQGDVYEFGTAEGKWHLASDGDVPSHEHGHGTLHKQNQFLIMPFGGEGRAIHEGSSDAGAALVLANADPHLSEDFSRHINKPESKDAGLRIAKNDLTLENAGDEAHARGRVYAGLEYSVFEFLVPKIGFDAARLLAFRLKNNHGPNYGFVFNVKPKDYVEAYKRGLAGLAREGQIPEGVTLGEVVAFVDEEARRRKMVGNELPDPDASSLDYLALTPEDLDSHTGADFGTVREGYEQSSNGGMIFRQPERNAVGYGIGVKTTYYQQYYPVSNPTLRSRYGDAAEVVNRAIIHRVDSDGRTLDVHSDVREIRQGEISERILVSEDRAVRAALKKVEEELKKLNLRQEGDLTRDEMERKAALQGCLGSVKTLEGRLMLADSRGGEAEKIKPRLVIMGDDKGLTYAVNLRYGTVYVHTQKTPTSKNLLFQSHIIQ